MSIALPWFTVAIATTTINGATLGFIARREGDAALRLWSWAWFLWAGAAVPLIVIGSAEPEPLVAIVCGLFWGASALCFLAGSYGFAQRTVPRVWYVVALVAGALAVGLGVSPTSEAAGMVPLVKRLYTRYYQGRLRVPLLRDVWGWFMAKANAWILSEDVRVIETHHTKISPDLDGTEVLVPSDGPIIAYRRLRQQWQRRRQEAPSGTSAVSGK